MTYTNQHGVTFTFINNAEQSFIGKCNGNCFGPGGETSDGQQIPACADPYCPSRTGIYAAIDSDEAYIKEYIS